MMEKCGCYATPINNKNVIHFCELHASAPDLAAENERLRAALKELVEAADPRTNMSDIPLLDALSVARAAIGGK